MKKEFVVKIEKGELVIPLERLKGINEGDLVDVEIEKAYADDNVKKNVEICSCPMKNRIYSLSLLTYF
jgi:hypothetical protein